VTSAEIAEEIRKKINDHSTKNDPKEYGADFYLPDTHGTAHISVIAPNGDAVSATSSINF
jgi:gamma-glutamyltranspeptidase/glutathione hydrolase/leukotriene-C4 hydrolase